MEFKIVHRGIYGGHRILRRFLFFFWFQIGETAGDRPAAKAIIKDYIKARARPRVARAGAST